MREAAERTEEPAREPTREPAPPSRAGRKAVVGYLSHEPWRELRYITINEGTSVQALILEAVEDLLRKKQRNSGTSPE